MYTKYPRTMHLPFSQGVQSDDKVIETLKDLIGKEIVVTEKMDGENTSMYYNHIHARSLDSRHHISRDWVKQYWAGIRYSIPEGWRVCGENLYAKHSLCYRNLESYFYGFSIWNDNNVALSWDDTLEWFDLLSIMPVPTLYRGKFDYGVLEHLANTLDTATTEGFVVRTVKAIEYKDFGTKAAKWVRKGHVQTDKHWKDSVIVPNRLRGI